MSSSSDLTKQLFEQIIASPDDDAIRLVYADHLLERGDSRGEMIQLQLRASPTRGEVDRMTSLRASNETRWLGPVARVTSDRVWSRGFLVEAVVGSRKKQELRGAMNHDAWALVRTVRLFESPRQEMTRPLIELLSHPGFRSLRSIKDGTASVAHGLLMDGPVEGGDPYGLAVDSLEVALGRSEDAALVQQALNGPGLKNLRSLTITGKSYNPGEQALLASNVGQRVEVLSVTRTTPRLLSWFRQLSFASKHLREVNLWWAGYKSKPDGWMLTLRRDQDETWSILEVRGRAEDARRFAGPLAGFLIELPIETLTRFEMHLAGETRMHLAFFRGIEGAIGMQRRLTEANISVPYNRTIARMQLEEEY